MAYHRSQVSVYRTIGPLVSYFLYPKSRLWVLVRPASRRLSHSFFFFFFFFFFFISKTSVLHGRVFVMIVGKMSLSKTQIRCAVVIRHGTFVYTTLIVHLVHYIQESEPVSMAHSMRYFSSIAFWCGSLKYSDYSVPCYSGMTEEIIWWLC